MRKIIILDTYPFQAEDFAFLGELGSYEAFESCSPEQVSERISEAEIVLTNKVILSAELLKLAKQLRYIGVLATGYNIIDIAAARKQGIVVTNVPAYSTDSVAQHTFALLLELTNHIVKSNGLVRQNAWAKSKHFCLAEKPLIELAHKTLGLIGCGAIAQQVARIAQGFGMKVIVYSRTEKEIPGMHFVSLAELLKNSDVVSLHCPLTSETQNLINAKTLAEMKSSAFLINTSRGPLVDEKALYEALKAGEIAGAGLDVLAAEPPPLKHPLTTLPNCVITPHIAWRGEAALARLLEIVQSNLLAFLQGKAQNVVS